jgi:hypothetical protein
MSDFLLGIDQSLKNTGLCLINYKTKTVLKTLLIHGPKTLSQNMNPDIDYYKYNQYRIADIIQQINKFIQESSIEFGFKQEDLYISLEHLSPSTSNSVDTIMWLSLLFLRIHNITSKKTIVIHSSTHKKMFFRENNVKMYKKLLYEYHGEKAFLNTGFKNLYLIDKTDDNVCDSFSLASAGSIYIKVCQNDFKEDDKINKTASEAIFCQNVKKSKLCAFCSKYWACTKKLKTSKKKADLAQKTPIKMY